jgi:hypothetical protein
VGGSFRSIPLHAFRLFEKIFSYFQRHASCLPASIAFIPIRILNNRMRRIRAAPQCAFELGEPQKTQIADYVNESIEINLGRRCKLSNIDGRTLHALLTALTDAERMYRKVGMAEMRSKDWKSGEKRYC